MSSAEQQKSGEESLLDLISGYGQASAEKKKGVETTSAVAAKPATKKSGKGKK